MYVSFGSFSRRWIPTAGYGHVFETRNGGARRGSNVSGNLPDAPVYKVAIRGGQLIAGSEVGAFIANRSHPTSWARLGSNLPNVTVWDLAVIPIRPRSSRAPTGADSGRSGFPELIGMTSSVWPGGDARPHP